MRKANLIAGVVLLTLCLGLNSSAGNQSNETAEFVKLLNEAENYFVDKDYDRAMMALDQTRKILEQQTKPSQETEHFFDLSAPDNTHESNKQERVNQAALFFFNEWIKRWGDYSVDYSMSLEKPPRVSASTSRLFYRDYLENNNINSLNKAIDIVSKQVNLYYHNYDKWEDAWGVENEFGELLFSFREIRNELSSETCQQIKIITKKFIKRMMNL